MQVFVVEGTHRTTSDSKKGLPSDCTLYTPQYDRHCTRSTPKMAAATASRIVRIQPNNTALFCCDLQERFAAAIYGWDAVIKTAHKMLKAAQILGLPVYATEQAPKALGKTVEPLQSVIASLPAPTTTNTIAKTRFSMVLPDQSPSTEEWLRDSKTKSVVIFGIESHVCVLQTTLDLLEKGFDVHVLADGVSSCNDGERGFALEVSGEALTCV